MMKSARIAVRQARALIILLAAVGFLTGCGSAPARAPARL